MSHYKSNLRDIEFNLFETHRGQDGEERVFSTVMEITGPDGYSVVTSEDGEVVMQIEFQRISRQDADEMVPGGVW